jgi:GNAT superfamily N-acetyltransferase
VNDLDEAAIRAVHRENRAGRLDRLVIDDLTARDLDGIQWSGPFHVRSVAQALDRVTMGEVEYLVIRAPGGEPVAKGGIDYAVRAGAGTFWQLATDSRLQGLGLGSRLIAEGERRIRKRGLRWAVLGVEDTNPRARALYERLGYEPWCRESASWKREGGDGRTYLQETELTVLRKSL